MLPQKHPTVTALHCECYDNILLIFMCLRFSFCEVFENYIYIHIPTKTKCSQILRMNDSIILVAPNYYSIIY